MRNLLILALGTICGILLIYSDSLSALILILIYIGLLISSCRQVRTKAVFVVVAGVLLGAAVSYIYNIGETIDNKYYVKSVYAGKSGLIDQFYVDGKLTAAESFIGNEKKWNSPGSSDLTELLVGEEVLLRGTFKMTPFDPAGYLYRGQELFLKKIEKKPSLRTELELFKQQLALKFAEIMGNESGPLAASLVLGIKDDRLKERMDILKYLGVIHILSISGFHLNLLEGLIKRTGLRRFSTLIILVYAVLIGSIPAWRAALMKTSKSIAFLLRRDCSALTQLACAALIQLLLNPYYLFNKSFQLTYAATLGLIFFREPLSRLVSGFPGNKIKEGVVLSSSAMIPCIPFLQAMSTDVNLALFPANFIIVPIYSFFCVTAFMAVPLILLNLQWSFLPIRIISGSLLAVINLLEYLIQEHLSLRIAWTGSSMLYLLVCLYLFMKRYPVEAKRKLLIMCSAVFIFFNLYFLPGSTKIRFQKERGQASITLEQNQKQFEFVTEKMYKRSVRLTAIPVDQTIRFGDITFSPAGGDFPGFTFNGKSYSPGDTQGIDAVTSEYLIMFGRIFRMN